MGSEEKSTWFTSCLISSLLGNIQYLPVRFLWGFLFISKDSLSHKVFGT